MNRRRQIRFRPVGFATDSPLEGDGFEPSVPSRERMLPFWRRGSRKGRGDEIAGPETVST
jgi:hypothetical protein